MKLFDDIKNALTGQTEMPIEEKEYQTDITTGQPYTDANLMAQEVMSQNEVELKTFSITPSKIEGSKYHESLIKEINLAVLSPNDEAYFTLCLQVLTICLDLGLTDVYRRLHSQMEAELMLTGSRKGKKLDLFSTSGHKIEKTISEVKQQKGGF